MSDEEFVDITISIRRKDLDVWHVYPNQTFVAWQIDAYQQDALGMKGELKIMLPDGHGIDPKWPVGTLIVHSHDTHHRVEK